ncbi:MAG: hypothetical protein ACRENI_05755 [Gemmatimonadaceae bacterium]
MKTIAIAVLVLLFGGRAGAQVVETPVAFDSAGRVMIITPPIAANLALRPPAWRITGDYREARLYALGNEGFVIVVTRPSGVVERYSLTASEREYLRVRTSTLPPDFLAEIAQTARATAQDAGRRVRNNAFIRNQTILGLVAYAPAFSVAISDHDAGQVAGYLLVAGGTFFAASEVERRLQISRAQNSLATDMAIKGTLSGLGLMHAADAESRATAAGAFVGGIAGTAAGLHFAQNMTENEAVASGFGSNALILTALGVITAADASDGIDLDSRANAGVLVAAAIAGYPLGYRYGRYAPYMVTRGDVGMLYTTGAIGVLAAGTAIAAAELDDAAAWGLGTVGFVGGLFAGDRILVRRYDHTRGEAGLFALGALAGGLMGAGLSVLIDGEDPSSVLTLSLATAGAAGGAALSHFYVAPRVDAGGAFSQVRFSPAGALLAWLGVEGRHSLLSLRF